MTPAVAPDYRRARERFRAAAGRRGAELGSYRHPERTGPDGCPLHVDVAWLGPADATGVLVCVSGTHGIEGHAGSACQVAVLDAAEPAPPETAALFVHALNPYGMAHDRRVNEDNVDVNRNGVDHAAPPDDAAYELVHDVLVPRDWSGPGCAAADRALAALAAERGTTFVQNAVTGGQWRHPDGLFYGGREPVWSSRVLRQVCAEFLPGRRRIGYLDLHTGLGERGAAEAIFRGGRDPRALDRARSWYGTVTRDEDGTASSTPIRGNTAAVVADLLTPDQELTAITLEFGTLPGPVVLTALRADNWLWLQERPEPELSRSVTARIRDAFCPDDRAWEAAVLAGARTAYRKALRGLGAPAEAGAPAG